MGVCPSPLPENVNHSPKYWPQRNQPFAVTVIASLAFSWVFENTSRKAWL